jgi:hypothetical protein
VVAIGHLTLRFASATMSEFGPTGRSPGKVGTASFDPKLPFGLLLNRDSYNALLRSPVSHRAPLRLSKSRIRCLRESPPKLPRNVGYARRDEIMGRDSQSCSFEVGGLRLNICSASRFAQAELTQNLGCSRPSGAWWIYCGHNSCNVAPCARRLVTSFCCADVREGAVSYAFRQTWRGSCLRRCGCGLDHAQRRRGLRAS